MKKKIPKSKWWVFEELPQELQDSHPVKEDFKTLREYTLVFDRWRAKAHATNPQFRKKVYQARKVRFQKLSKVRLQKYNEKRKAHYKTSYYKKYNAEFQRRPEQRQKQQKRNITKRYGQEFMDLILMIYKINQKVKELKNGTE